MAGFSGLILCLVSISTAALPGVRSELVSTDPCLTVTCGALRCISVKVGILYKPGYKCERDKTACYPNPCNGQSCMGTVFGHECYCDQGYSGINCERKDGTVNQEVNQQGKQEVDHCQSNPCQNGGRCFNRPNEYFCDCPVNFHGHNCALRKNNICMSRPCQNGGKCVQFPSWKRGYGCICGPNYNGNDCEIMKQKDHCQSTPCQNGGSCVSVNSPNQAYYCRCAHNYYGNNCEMEMIDHCQSSPCQNGGFCQRVNNPNQPYYCKCPQPFYGDNCEIGNPCLSNTDLCPPNQTCLQIFVPPYYRCQRNFRRFTYGNPY